MTSNSDDRQAIDLFQNPLSWQELTEGFVNCPRELEIGTGKGLFLQMAGSSHPERHYIGIELSAKFARRAAQRLSRHQLNNVTMLRGDARKLLRETIADQSMDRVHVYFPDPWWRNKHKKRRVLNDQTLQDIQRVLKPAGEFHFWTDVLDYYEHQCEQVMQLTRLSGPYYVPQRDPSHTMDFATHFERRARLNGQPVYRAVFVANNQNPAETRLTFWQSGTDTKRVH